MTNETPEQFSERCSKALKSLELLGRVKKLDLKLQPIKKHPHVERSRQDHGVFRISSSAYVWR